MNKMNKKGFTLVEMLVVIAIIAVLVAIIIPTVSSATDKAAAAANAANLRSTAASISIKILDGSMTETEAESLTTTEVKGITPPVAKKVEGITGGTFKCVVTGTDVVCSFGDDGTIANYANIAGGNKS